MVLLSVEVFLAAQVKVPYQRTFLPIPSTSVFAAFLSFEKDFFLSSQVLLSICPNIMCHKRENRNYSRKKEILPICLSYFFIPVAGFGGSQKAAAGAAALSPSSPGLPQGSAMPQPWQGRWPFVIVSSSSQEPEGENLTWLNL